MQKLNSSPYFCFNSLYLLSPPRPPHLLLLQACFHPASSSTTNTFPKLCTTFLLYLCLPQQLILSRVFFFLQLQNNCFRMHAAWLCIFLTALYTNMLHKNILLLTYTILKLITLCFVCNKCEYKTGH